MTIPAGATPSGEPVGLQLITRHGGEQLLLRLAMEAKGGGNTARLGEGRG
ncbi:hypothetical protein K9U14_23250 [Streptomyces griseocarneus]|nr:hypothetical protein [Streptomyces griseocarneus]